MKLSTISRARIIEEATSAQTSIDVAAKFVARQAELAREFEAVVLKPLNIKMKDASFTNKAMTMVMVKFTKDITPEEVKEVEARKLRSLGQLGMHSKLKLQSKGTEQHGTWYSAS